MASEEIAQPAKVEPKLSPDQSTGVRHLTRERVQFKEAYISRMTGKKYKSAMTQLEQQGMLHTDAHLLLDQEIK